MTSALFMDLSRAFDCVNHEKLLSKLRHYGIRGIAHELFRSYLSSRRQFVSVCSGVSDFLSVDIGVPQGSILGPILFLVYMNDLPANLTNCCTILFADDTTIINSELNEETLCERHRLNMAEAERWFGCNGLKLNTEKTQRIQFMPRPGASSSVKLLGVLVDSGLRWKEHINFLAGKLNASIYQIRKTAEILNDEAARMLYFATFQSTVSYSIVLWGNSSGWRRVFILQKKAVRILGGAHYREHCKPYFKKLKILTVPSLYIYHALLYVKANLGSFSRRADIHEHQTRGSRHLEIPFHRLNISQGSVLYQGVKLFNALERDVQCLPLCRFKICVKNMLLNEAFYSVSEFFECMR